jgi:hypothetical protein
VKQIGIFVGLPVVLLAMLPGPTRAQGDSGSVPSEADEPSAHPSEQRLDDVRPPPDLPVDKRSGDGSAVASEQIRLADIEQRLNDMEARAAEPGHAISERTIDLYGFLDTGLQRLFVDSRSPLNGVYPTRASTFVLGKANLYIDAHPGPGWRTLIETRLTLYPNGVESFTPNYQRVDTRIYDSNEPNGRSRVPWGSIVMERAWGEWSYSQALTLQAGLFPAPYGIWNIDHGTPVLISLLLPAFQVEEAIPSRLVGVHAYGNFVFGALDVGYHAYVSNGRTVTNVDLTDDKAIGGRLFLRHGGTARWTLGTSGYWGSSSDDTKQLDFSSGSFGVTATKLWAFHEWAGGVDLSVDWGNWRLRTEGLLHRVHYDAGAQNEPGLGPPGSVRPNRFNHYWYGLLAHRLARRIEPYVYVEIKYSSPADFLSDLSFTPSLGLNIYFKPWAQLKTQYADSYFFKTDGPDPANVTIRYLTSRLVFVF